MSSDFISMLFAILIYISIPSLLIYLSRKSDKYKKLLMPVIGAISPLILFYMFAMISHVFKVINSSVQDTDKLVMGEMFVMTFVGFFLLLSLGVIASIIFFKVENLLLRYLIGFFFGPLILFIVAFH